MELVVDDRRVGQILLNAGDAGRAHVDARLGDGRRVAGAQAEILGEPGDGLPVASRARLDGLSGLRDLMS